MSSSLKNILKYGFVIALMGGLIWLSFNGVGEENLKPGESKLQYFVRLVSVELKNADKIYLVLSALVALLSHFFRSERWRILLKPLGYEVSSLNSFLATFNAYFINLAIPRGGEISRPVALKRMEGVPVDTSLGTVVTERIIDLLFLALVVGLSALLQIDKLVAFFAQLETKADIPAEEESIVTLLAVGAVLSFIVLIIVLYIFKRSIFDQLYAKGKSFILGMKDGFLSVFKLDQNLLFVFYSFMIWVMYYLMLYTVLLAFEDTEHIGFMDSLAVFAVGGIAMVLPSPGGAGSYHFFVSRALFFICGLASIDKALTFVSIFWGWQTILIIVVGSIGLFLIERQTKKYKDGKSAQDR